MAKCKIEAENVGCWVFQERANGRNMAVYYCEFCGAACTTHPQYLPRYCTVCGKKMRED